MTQRLTRAGLALTALLMSVTPALGQALERLPTDIPQDERGPGRPVPYNMVPDTPDNPRPASRLTEEERIEQAVGTDQLNQQALAKVKGSDRVDQRENEAYADALAAREAQIKAQNEEYQRKQAAWRAAVAAQEAENLRKRREWEAAVAACNAGDFSKCAKQ